MIQRIQSIFLFLGALCIALLFSDSLPMLAVTDQSLLSQIPSNAMLEDGLFDISDHIILIIFTIASVILFVVGIFSFKNRKKQIQLIRFILILTILFIVLMFVLLMQEIPLINSNVADQVSVKAGSLFPFLAIIFALLAMRFIKKDEKLVRSADRLR